LDVKRPNDCTPALEVTNLLGKLMQTIKVSGGGINGQAGGIRHGIARALKQYETESGFDTNAEDSIRRLLKKAGFPHTRCTRS